LPLKLNFYFFKYESLSKDKYKSNNFSEGMVGFSIFWEVKKNGPLKNPVAA